MSIPTTTNIYGKNVVSLPKSDIILKTNKLSGLKYPIERVPGRGYYSKSTGFDLIKSSLSSLIKTERGERFMLPEYGCNLKKFLMEPLDETTFSLIREEILTSINKYLRKVQVNKLQVFETNSGALNVKLFCSIKDNAIVNFDLGIQI